jgi:transposase
MERTAMSRKEFERGTVFERVKAGSLPLRDAAVLLELSYRQAKRLSRRYRADGAQGLVHGSVGRRPNSARPEADRERVLALIREHYGGRCSGARASASALRWWPSTCARITALTCRARR